MKTPKASKKMLSKKERKKLIKNITKSARKDKDKDKNKNKNKDKDKDKERGKTANANANGNVDEETTSPSYTKTPQSIKAALKFGKNVFKSLTKSAGSKTGNNNNNNNPVDTSATSTIESRNIDYGNGYNDDAGPAAAGAGASTQRNGGGNALPFLDLPLVSGPQHRHHHQQQQQQQQPYGGTGSPRSNRHSMHNNNMNGGSMNSARTRNSYDTNFTRASSLPTPPTNGILGGIRKSVALTQKRGQWGGQKAKLEQAKLDRGHGSNRRRQNSIGGGGNSLGGSSHHGTGRNSQRGNNHHQPHQMMRSQSQSPHHPRSSYTPQPQRRSQLHHQQLHPHSNPHPSQHRHQPHQRPQRRGSTGMVIPPPPFSGNNNNTRSPKQRAKPYRNQYPAKMENLLQQHIDDLWEDRPTQLRYKDMDNMSVGTHHTSRSGQSYGNRSYNSAPNPGTNGSGNNNNNNNNRGSRPRGKNLVHTATNNNNSSGGSYRSSPGQRQRQRQQQTGWRAIAAGVDDNGLPVPSSSPRVVRRKVRTNDNTHTTGGRQMTLSQQQALQQRTMMIRHQSVPQFSSSFGAPNSPSRRRATNGVGNNNNNNNNNSNNNSYNPGRPCSGRYHSGSWSII